MQPNFFAIIPASVRYDDNVIPNAKLLYGEISAMCNVEGYCWAENSYFANLYKVSSSTISRWVSQLEKNGHIKTKLNKKEGNKRKIVLAVKSQKPIDEKRKTSCGKAQDLLTKSANQYMRIIQLIIQLIERNSHSLFLKIISLLLMKSFVWITNQK